MAIEGERYSLYRSNPLNQYTSIRQVRGEEAPETFAPEYDADGNQTKVQTSTGIWSVEYNAENRPIHFTRMDEDGSTTQIACTYDHMGRRATKKVTTGGAVTLHRRYLYRGYLQIAACDQTRSGHPCLWHLTWDPTQPIATRPLALRKDGTWYTYGWDLTKNICEVYKTNGGIGTAYTYTPYGEVSTTGNVTQPIQWFSEHADPELGLTYYNYRHYNPSDGRWLGRDLVGENISLNTYKYLDDSMISDFDVLGLTSFTTLDGLAGYEAELAIKAQVDAYIKSLLVLSASQADLVKNKRWRKCAPCDPPVGTIMYRIDDDGEPHFCKISNREELIHTHYYIVSQTPADASPPCLCRRESKDAVPGRKARGIPQREVKGGGLIIS